jgi:hypothetical protein
VPTREAPSVVVRSPAGGTQISPLRATPFRVDAGVPGSLQLFGENARVLRTCAKDPWPSSSGVTRVRFGNAGRLGVQLAFTLGRVADECWFSAAAAPRDALFTGLPRSPGRDPHLAALGHPS